MTKIFVSASRPYPVEIGRGLLDTVGDRAATLLAGRKAVIVSDSHVAPLYGERVKGSLEKAGFSVRLYVFPAGEGSKNGETYLSLLDFLAEQQLTRADGIFALGGGVVGDLAGFAAATYLRGIPYFQLPTTLLSAVDSSVGGKTAIDLPHGKNLAGAFYPPKAVLCDTAALETLSEETFSDGCAEVIKYGMIGDSGLLNLLEQLDIRKEPETVIARCVTMKKTLTERDEFDTGERQLLNLGHTAGHAIELCSGYKISHGKAVAVGMMLIAKAAVFYGLCPKEVPERLNALLKRFSLPDKTVFSAQTLYEASLSDKKRTGDKLTLVVPTAWGNSVRHTVSLSDWRDWLERGTAL